MDKNTLLFDIQKFCIHDGPGIRTNIFFKGCSLKCSWCANPESQSFEPELFINKIKCIGCGNCVRSCPNETFNLEDGKVFFDRKKCVNCGECIITCHSGARKLYGTEYTIEEIISEAEKDRAFYDNSGGGVTFSGGEPALWPDHIRRIAKHFFNEEVSTVIETCGYAPWENYEKFIEYISLIMFDVKIWDSEKHKKYCGTSNELIFENLKKVSQKNSTIVRIPIIPEINDSEKEIRYISEYLKTLGTIKIIHILAYHNMATGKYDGLGRTYPLQNIIPPSDDHMQTIKTTIEEYGFNVKIGG